MIAKSKKSTAPADPRSYGCCRVSSDRQERSGLGLESQDAIIREYIERYVTPRGVTFAEMSIDTISAYKKPFMLRPESGRICRMLREGDHLVVAKHDRMFRSMLDFGVCYNELVEKRGVILHVINLNFDTSKKESLIFGKLLLGIFTAVAEYESAINAQRQRDANAIRRRQGRHIAGRAPLGFKVVGPTGKRTLIPDEEARVTLRWIVDQRNAGHSFLAIYHELKRRNEMRRVADKNQRKGYRLEPWRQDLVEPAYWSMVRIDEMDALIAAEKALQERESSSG